MTRRQAKAYVLRVLSVEALHHLDNASEWLERPLADDGIRVHDDGAFSPEAHARVVDAVRKVAAELLRRSKRLAKPASRDGAR